MSHKYQRSMDLKAMVPSLKKELGLIEKNLFNCYLKAETVFIPLSSIKDMLVAFMIPGSLYKSLVDINNGDESALCALNEIINVIKKHLRDIESPHLSFNVNDWVDGLPFIARNRIFVKSLKGKLN